MTFPQNQPTIGTPKTEKGKRQIPLDEELLRLFMPLKESGFIIGGDKPITRMVYRRRWERIAKKVCLFDATAHIFRHTYLTLASNAGIDLKTLQALGGHADIGTTMNKYVHAQIGKILEAGQTMHTVFTQQ